MDNGHMDNGHIFMNGWTYTLNRRAKYENINIKCFEMLRICTIKDIYRISVQFCWSDPQKVCSGSAKLRRYSTHISELRGISGSSSNLSGVVQSYTSEVLFLLQAHGKPPSSSRQLCKLSRGSAEIHEDPSQSSSKLQLQCNCGVQHDMLMELHGTTWCSTRIV